ncbi:hypothetical protein BG011_002351 [Mortierella polycephala]|uniref:Dolichyl-diphosphooligosaccharide-protein glycosyltransferase subunit OST5 n=1 Tax=Mortierella polycephala TaxID=41804 RepID=A0A9P6Q573_9FUNG|nr:hypothetical protein BG011_002351 [Mortierella polycephala]
MDPLYSELNAAWEAGTPFAPPLPVSVQPVLAFVTLSAGLLFAAKFGIAQKPVLVHDLATSIPSAILLGFGVVFLFLSAGLYL